MDETIEVGSCVDVPEPEIIEDAWSNGFEGTVIKIVLNIATVEDQDGDCFDIEYDRLELAN